MHHEDSRPPEAVSVSGSCLCGAVKYRAETNIRRVVNCHCGLCRRMNGSAFSSYAVIPFKALVIFGAMDLRSYAVTPRATKHYCGKCGTPLFNLNTKYSGACMLYLGAIEGGETYSPSLNVYCEDMLSWLDKLASIEALQAGVESGK